MGRSNSAIAAAMLLCATALAGCLPPMPGSDDEEYRYNGEASADATAWLIDWPTGANTFDTGWPSLRLGGKFDGEPYAPMTWENVTTGETGGAQQTVESECGIDYLTGQRWCNEHVTWSSSPVTLAEGANVVQVHWRHHVDEIVLTYLPGHPDPEIRITQPTEEEAYLHTGSSDITLRGERSESWDAYGVRAYNFANGAWVETSASGFGGWSLMIRLAEGSNRIAVTASDEAGNEATDEITVEYQGNPL